MEIMYKNNMIYIRKQISVCIWKTRSTPTLFPFITVKWIIPNVYMKDQKKMEEKCPHYVGNSIQQKSI